jgi:hypothetical protein
MGARTAGVLNERLVQITATNAVTRIDLNVCRPTAGPTDRAAGEDQTTPTSPECRARRQDSGVKISDNPNWSGK